MTNYDATGSIGHTSLKSVEHGATSSEHGTAYLRQGSLENSVRQYSPSKGPVGVGLQHFKQ